MNSVSLLEAGGQQFPQQTFLERHNISPVLFAFISLILIFFLYQGIGGVVTVLLVGTRLTPEYVNGLRTTTLLGQLLFILLPTLLLTRLATNNVSSFLRLRLPKPLTLFIPLVGIFSLQQVLQVFLIYQEKIPLPEDFQHFLDPLKQLIEETYKLLVGSTSLPELLFVLLVIAFVPAIAEELLFRGMIQRSFEKGLGSRRGLLLTAVIFALYHLNPFSFIPLIFLGIYLGFLTMRTDSILVSMAAHFYNNAIACIAIYAGKGDDYLVTGNPEQLSHGELMMTVMFFSVVFFLSTYYFIRVTKPADSGQTSSVMQA